MGMDIYIDKIDTKISNKEELEKYRFLENKELETISDWRKIDWINDWFLNNRAGKEDMDICDRSYIIDEKDIINAIVFCRMIKKNIDTLEFEYFKCEKFNKDKPETNNHKYYEKEINKEINMIETDLKRILDEEDFEKNTYIYNVSY